MIKFSLIILISLFLFSCENSPNTGISSNPNFVKGTIYYKDDKPISNAKVMAYNDQDSIINYTDSKGEFILDVTSNDRYSLEVSYNGFLLFLIDEITFSNTDSISSDNGHYSIIDGDIIINTIYNEEDIIPDSLLNDTTFVPTDTSLESTTVAIETNVKTLSQITTFPLTPILFLDTIASYDNTANNYSSPTNFSGNSNEYMKLGYDDCDRTVSSFIGKLKDISEFNYDNIDKVEIEFEVSFPFYSYFPDTVKVYQFTQDNSKETNDTNESTINKQLFFKKSTSQIISKNKLTIDITDVYTIWQKDGKNYGFEVTFSENKKSFSNYLIVSTSESSSQPAITFYNKK